MTKKKWVLPLIIGVVVVAIIAGIFIASVVGKNGIESRISEVRDVIYKGDMDGKKITAISGEREKNYKVDGTCNGTADFLIITLEGNFVENPEYSMQIDGNEYKGTMQKHPFNDEYSCEIPKRVNCSELDLRIKVDKVEKSIKLRSIVSSSFITANDALTKSQEVLLDSINDFDGEIYVRLIENPLKSDEKYFWYVAYCFSNGDVKSVLFDATTGEAVAVKRE